MFKKLLLLFLLIPIAFAATSKEESVFTNIQVVINTNQVNITPEDGSSRIYNCNLNSTQSFSYSFKRNVSYDCQEKNIDKIEEGIKSLKDTCNSISTLNEDRNKYFTLYATCNAENQVCQSKLSDKDSKISELGTLKAASESCNIQLGNIQQFNQEMVQRLQTSMDNSTRLKSVAVHESNQKMFYGILGAVAVGILWIIDRRKLNPETNRGRIGGLR